MGDEACVLVFRARRRDGRIPQKTLSGIAWTQVQATLRCKEGLQAGIPSGDSHHMHQAMGWCPSCHPYNAGKGATTSVCLIFKSWRRDGRIQETYERDCDGQSYSLMRCKKLGCNLEFKARASRQLPTTRPKKGIGCPECVVQKHACEHGDATNHVSLIAAKNGKLACATVKSGPEVCTDTRYTPPIECLGCGETVSIDDFSS